jgi:hypothetical protein
VFSFGYYLIKNDGLKVAELYIVYAAMTFSSLVLGRVYSQLPDQRKAASAAKTSSLEFGVCKARSTDY